MRASKHKSWSFGNAHTAFGKVLRKFPFKKICSNSLSSPTSASSSVSSVVIKTKDFKPCSWPTSGGKDRNAHDDIRISRSPSNEKTNSGGGGEGRQRRAGRDNRISSMQIRTMGSFF
eukprot:CAMPEP_0177565240 /NCGR_PEP_ID=MMETSP0369-20130122/74040_1 /TAXON_ID=447022 ORGANISM="Scrippsiella hangoei-like, Strain SHHI-4" /NCGR_SAMPLE_ID=MMETSP0369 /ASSEMBLY_ACC=CAM_ASM_000364 /LENGTH=116 /DNA_ID=CAMNT_0019052575 /DNA_START=231 /DNA_END=578 /DNA_ORIENTATION=-